MLTKIQDDFYIDFDDVFYVNVIANTIYIFCKSVDCPLEITENDDAKKSFMNELNKYSISTKKDPLSMKWISLDDEIPKHGEKYLFLSTYSNSCWFEIRKVNSTHKTKEIIKRKIGFNITHWMPLLGLK